MPSFSIAFSLRISTSTPSFVKASARAANSFGPSTFGGSLTRSRAMMTPAASAIAHLIGLLDGCRIRNLEGQAGVAGRLIVVLLGFVAIEAVAAQARAEGQIREVVGARVEAGQIPQPPSRCVPATLPAIAPPS